MPDHVDESSSAAGSELKVFISSQESTCDECKEKLGRQAWILLAGNKGALCLACADMDHLVFLPAGDAALTRRACRFSSLSAVVLKWSRARKRYERQGPLMEEAALLANPIGNSIVQRAVDGSPAHAGMDPARPSSALEVDHIERGAPPTAPSCANAAPWSGASWPACRRGGGVAPGPPARRDARREGRGPGRLPGPCPARRWSKHRAGRTRRQPQPLEGLGRRSGALAPRPTRGGQPGAGCY